MLGVRPGLDLWFWHSPLGPSVIPFAPTKPLGPNSSRLSQVPPPAPDAGSQDPQLNYSRPALPKASWASDAIIRTIQGLLMIVWLLGWLPCHPFFKIFISFAVNFCIVLPPFNTLLAFWHVLGRWAKQRRYLGGLGGHVEFRLSSPLERCHAGVCVHLFTALVLDMPAFPNYQDITVRVSSAVISQLKHPTLSPWLFCFWVNNSCENHVTAKGHFTCLVSIGNTNSCNLIKKFYYVLYTW